MSYNRMDNPNDFDKKPLNNGERYPPIPLPPPSPASGTGGMSNTNMTGMEAVYCAPILETGQIVTHNTPGFVLANDIEVKNLIFNDQTIRKGFIRKVYLILLTQLLFTCGIIAIFTFHDPTKLFIQKNPEVIAVAVIVNIVVMFSMACCETARRNYPINFVCLGLFTATMSLLLGIVASRVDANIVLLAVGVTAILVISLSIFAIQTKYDFTALRACMITVVICLVIIAYFGVFLQQLLGNAIVSSIGALLASFMLIYDTQLIIGGNHKYQFNPEEYVFAALTLYVDVVRIFLYVLRLFARK